MAQRIQLRRGPAAQWAEVNPVLGIGEPGIETDTGRQKFGDGVTPWNGRPYASKGDKGDQGAPGIADDASVAAQVTSGAQTVAALSATYGPRVAGYVYATEFGCKFDGTTDDTANLQAFVSYVAINGLVGILPKGTAKLTAKIDIPRRPGWQLRGAGREVTVLKQFTDDTPILDLGAIAGSQVHSYAISDIRFDYANTQPATNTSANPIVFSQECYWGNLERLTFMRGSYAMRVAAGVGGPWGSTFDDLTFQINLTGGAMDWSQCINGVPNNRFGRLFVDATNMVNPIFQLRGYNFRIDTIEVCQAQSGAPLLVFAPSTRVDIGTVKLENGTYTTSKNLIDFQGNAYGKIGHITVTGHTMIVNAPGGSVNLLAVGTGAGVQGFVSVDYIEVGLSALTAGGAYVASPASTSDGLEINKLSILNAWKLLNNGSTTSANRTSVRRFTNGRISLDKGDANYTVVPGDPNVVIYNTVLTAPRTVNLPTDLSLLPNGLYYEFCSVGAVNGANTITIKNGATTVATLTGGTSKVRVVFRRTSTDEWVALP